VANQANPYDEAIAELAPFVGLPHYGDAVLCLRYAQRQKQDVAAALKRIKAAFAEYQDGISYGQR
jgi:hypothetical protein